MERTIVGKHPVYHLVVMGVSGSGKTTLAENLSKRLGLDFAEADSFHSASNVEKMSHGEPLTDEDRMPWLSKIRDWMTTEAVQGESTVVSCSALRRAYREVLDQAPGEVFFIHLYGDQETLRARMEGRKDHFMPPDLLPSQLATLEHLAPDEHGIEIELVDDREQLVSLALKKIEEYCPGLCA